MLELFQFSMLVWRQLLVLQFVDTKCPQILERSLHTHCPIPKVGDKWTAATCPVVKGPTSQSYTFRSEGEDRRRPCDQDKAWDFFLYRDLIKMAVSRINDPADPFQTNKASPKVFYPPTPHCWANEQKQSHRDMHINYIDCSPWQRWLSRTRGRTHPGLSREAGFKE